MVKDYRRILKSKNIIMIRVFQTFLDKRNIPSSFVDEQRTMLHFTIDNINYLFSYNFNEDPVYVRIIIPNAGEVDLNEAEDVRMLYDLTNTYKVGKAYAANGQVWFSTEAFIYIKEEVDPLFQRMIQVLHDMLNQYRLKYNGSKSK